MTRYFKYCFMVTGKFIFSGNRHKRIYFLVFLVCFISSCKNSKKRPPGGPVASIDNSKDMTVSDILDFADNNKGQLNDSTRFYYPSLLHGFYKDQQYQPVWSDNNKFTALADTLFRFIDQSMLYGLFPEDYHRSLINNLKSRLTDHSGANRQTVFAESDLLLTDAFIRIGAHLQQGRLDAESSSFPTGKAFQEYFFVDLLKTVFKNHNLVSAFQSLEPKNKDYLLLKEALPSFLQTMDVNRYTVVEYPNKDSVQLIQAIAKRLTEAGIAGVAAASNSSGSLAGAISRFQLTKGLKPTGKIDAELVRSMNANDWYKFKRIATTLDRFKSLPSVLPETYVWVNLPSFSLKLIRKDSVLMTSKVIIGKPTNQTPELNSAIYNIMLYPTWSVPYSIAVNEMLPIAKRNPGYFAKKGFKVFNNHGVEVDPYSVNWSKYRGNVPYRFRQDEGDGNALGVIKFNFENPYSVYLHDTNNRSLFSNEYRALSHGCVRVHLWDSLAKFLIKESHAYYMNYETAVHDSITPEHDTIVVARTIRKDSAAMDADSLKRFLARGKNMAITMPKKIPIFIRYFGCGAQNGKLVFFNDVYNDDKRLVDKYFSKR